jgi:hypothetical protein
LAYTGGISWQSRSRLWWFSKQEARKI